MTDRIHIRDLELRCIIGIFPDERKNKQDVVINVSLEADLSGVAGSDDIDATIDYKSINKGIISLVESSEFYLIETLAERVAELCLEDRRVQRVSITVDKPGALRFARSVAVELNRDQA